MKYVILILLAGCATRQRTEQEWKDCLIQNMYIKTRGMKDSEFSRVFTQVREECGPEPEGK